MRDRESTKNTRCGITTGTPVIRSVSAENATRTGASLLVGTTQGPNGGRGRRVENSARSARDEIPIENTVGPASRAARGVSIGRVSSHGPIDALAHLTVVAAVVARGDGADKVGTSRRKIR